MARRFIKQPSENLDYDFDFGPWLEDEADTLQASTGSSDVSADAGVTLGTKTHDVAMGIVKQWISGGTAGQRYQVTCQITTTGGRVKEAELVIVVQDN